MFQSISISCKFLLTVVTPHSSCSFINHNTMFPCWVSFHSAAIFRNLSNPTIDAEVIVDWTFCVPLLGATTMLWKIEQNGWHDETELKQSWRNNETKLRKWWNAKSETNDEMNETELNNESEQNDEAQKQSKTRGRRRRN
jgi:hypothetical protein